MADATLVAGAAQLGIELEERQAAQLVRLLDELDDWNQRMNLTAIRERGAQITKHLLDSLSVQRFLQGERVLDVGTGPGFPGLPLAIVNPTRQFTLLDSTAKKLKFIDHVVGLLELPNVQTVHTRAENFRPAQRFDIVVSRAVGPVEQFVKWAGHLCVGGGRLLAMKGRHPAAELEKLPSGWKLAAVHRLNVPALDEERHLVEICRSHERL
ncbi:16S rRNA (guanine(527)-N(7))-methyltransferase RsmG [Steroidobacter sp. S1-65]|uniref:Ribosomal RNA small subunit methyltransferase G n=1 Tax=Steroidobacter gossypii TaxID=2805490 RepID=A0ABS1WTB9_9GAMM|nr:16S rRNA (guanine(527)-N(7))-methyltransferase RsmG [Steroidobacter gossypii]MBM0104177.1 16S rRNA (guanine(527)-N(7))-methyltransferase RsmG [Steroidobacter gossypii]